MQPTVQDIRYYQGDSFTLYVYPKDATGAYIPLVQDVDVPFFNVADKRGLNPTVRLSTTAELVDLHDDGINCIAATMDSAVGENIKNGYVYDLGWIKGGYKTTAITGKMIVMEDVAGYIA